MSAPDPHTTDPRRTCRPAAARRSRRRVGAWLALAACALWLSACGAGSAGSARPHAAKRASSVGTPKGRGVPLAERGPSQPQTPQTPPEPDPAEEPAPQGATRVGATAASATPGLYKVQLSPPSKVGDRFRMEVSATLRQVFASRIDGKERRVDTTNRLDVVAVGEVLEVNARGQVLRSAYKIKRCVGTGAKGERELLAEGTTLTVRRNGPKPRMDADSRALSKTDLRWLRLVFSTRTPSYTDQEIFGASGPRRVGDAWTIDTDKAAELLKSSGAVIDPADVSGTTTLVAARPCGKETCLTVTTALSGSQVRLSKVPPTATLLDSGMSGTSRQVFPLKPGAAPTRSDDVFKLHVTVAVPRGDQELEVEARIESRERRVHTPLP